MEAETEGTQPQAEVTWGHRSWQRVGWWISQKDVHAEPVSVT